MHYLIHLMIFFSLTLLNCNKSDQTQSPRTGANQTQSDSAFDGGDDGQQYTGGSSTGGDNSTGGSSAGTGGSVTNTGGPGYTSTGGTSTGGTSGSTTGGTTATGGTSGSTTSGTTSGGSTTGGTTSGGTTSGGTTSGGTTSGGTTSGGSTSGGTTSGHGGWNTNPPQCSQFRTASFSIPLIQTTSTHYIYQRLFTRDQMHIQYPRWSRFEVWGDGMRTNNRLYPATVSINTTGYAAQLSDPGDDTGLRFFNTGRYEFFTAYPGPAVLATSGNLSIVNDILLRVQIPKNVTVTVPNTTIYYCP